MYRNVGMEFLKKVNNAIVEARKFVIKRTPVVFLMDVLSSKVIGEISFYSFTPKFFFSPDGSTFKEGY